MVKRNNKQKGGEEDVEIRIGYLEDLGELSSLPENLTRLTISGIDEFLVFPDGFVFPPRLTYLDIVQVGLVRLPTLPDLLEEMVIINCKLDELPLLPLSLKKLTCCYTELDELPIFHEGLVELYCNNNRHLTEIRQLPDSLESFDCEECKHLVKLPDRLPTNILQFNCVGCRLNNLPTLNLRVKMVVCSQNRLQTLPELTDSLTHLFCDENRLQTLPELTDSLTFLNCDKNQLTTLPKLPNSLDGLYCDNNELTTLPDELPNSLTSLCCSNNLLQTLPKLPNSLTSLSCNKNRLTSLPLLHRSLELLNCNNNLLTALPPLLETELIRISCIDNLLTLLPDFPNSLLYLNCSNNQLEAFPPSLPHLVAVTYGNPFNPAVGPRIAAQNRAVAFEVHNAFASMNFVEIRDSIKKSVPNLPEYNPHDIKEIFTSTIKEAITHLSSQYSKKTWTDKLNLLNTQRLDGYNLEEALEDTHFYLVVDAGCCVLRYVSLQDPSFKRLYISILLTDATEAYVDNVNDPEYDPTDTINNVKNRLSCVKGIFERIIISFVSAVKYTDASVVEKKRMGKRALKKTRKHLKTRQPLFEAIKELKDKDLQEDVLQWFKAHKDGNGLPHEDDVEGRKKHLKAYLLEERGYSEDEEGKINKFIEGLNFDNAEFAYGGGKGKRKIKKRKTRKLSMRRGKR
jgi:Leucine-rich repeat (LRR) protein